ncbi:MAG TPA: hypothetical protein GXX36_10405 [Clostridiaceae bacterium]|nr:hypothetical protein [Clostridiaceae bacterium]
MRLSVEETLRNLKQVEEKYKIRFTPTGEVNISEMARDCIDTIKALQQENEQLRAQLESLRCSSCGELPELIATDDGDYCEKCAEGIEYKEMIDLHTYHNPADVEALRKAREALDYWRELYGIGLEVLNWHMNGNTEPFDSFYDNSGTYEALAEIDKAIGGGQ